MGFFDGFKKKKDEFSQNPDFGMPQQDPNQGFPPLGQQDMNFGQDPFSQPQQPSFGQEYSQQPMQPQNFTPEQAGFERIQPGQQSGFSQQHSGSQNLSDISIGKDFEIVNAKLDAIKAELDSMSQRIKRIERIHDSENYGKKDPWY